MHPWQLPYVMVGMAKPKTFGELSEDLKIPSATLSKCLKLLVKKDFAEIKLRDDHFVKSGARWLYKLTPKGVKQAKIAKSLVTHEKALWDQLLSKD